MRTRSKSYPNNSNATIPRRRNRRRVPNIVEPEIRTIDEVIPMADRTMEELLQAPTEGESSSKTDDRIDKLEDQISKLVEIINKQVITPATVKAVEKSCVICGGAHAYYDCIATDSNQSSVCAATGTYNQVSPPNRASNQMAPPGFAPVQNNQNRRNLNNDMRSILGSFFQNQASTAGTLPSNTILNPKGEMKAVITRSGLACEGPSIPTNSTPEKVMERETELNDQKLREKTTNQMEKFFQIFYDLHFDISFADALLLMPKFASTIKSLLTNKDKLFELAKVPLNENCSAMLLKKLLEKLGDPGKFLIPCDFPRMDVCHALADLGASINLMPLSIWIKLSLPEITPTRMTLKLADRSINRLRGVAEDVFVKVGKFHFPTDFVVVDFEADPRVPLILGRSFLKTGYALIDVYGEEITLRVNDESVTFNLNQTMRYSCTYDDNSMNRIDVIDIAFEENRVTRPKKYSELSATEAIQADCDVKATKIILQGLPPETTSLTKQERECKLYDEFDKFAYKNGESLRDFYLRFSLLLNDMNIYNMKLEQFQVNTKFLNTLPPEWSKFVTDVKLVRDLHTTNVDQLHAYLGQHEYHVNEVRLMHERTSDPLALVANHQMNKSPYQPHQQSYQQHQFQPQVSTFQSFQYGTPYHSSQYAAQAQSSTPLSITYPSNDFQSSVNHNVYNPSSSIPQVEYALSVHQHSEFSQPDTGFVVPVFQKGDDPIDAINHMMSFLTAVVTSWYPPTNNQLRTSLNPRQQATINNKRVTIQPIKGRQNSMTAANLSHYGFDNLAEAHNQDNVTNNVIDQDVQATSTSEQLNILNQSETKITSDSNIISYSQYMNESQYTTVQNSSSPVQQDDLIFSMIEQLKTQVVNCTKINQDNKNVNEILTAELERYKDQLEPKLYDGSVIQKTDAIVIRNSEETLILEDESHSKMLQKQKDPMMYEKKVNIKPVDYAALNQLSKDFETRFVTQTELSAEQAFWSQNSRNSEEPNLSTSTTIVEVPKELPKVSMVNSSLKKLKFHLASYDMVVKERTTATAITEGEWGFEHTKACFRDEIIPFAVEQHCIEKNKFQDKMKNILKENERLLEQAMSTDIVNIVVNANVNYACKTVNDCARCVTIETELQKDFIKKEFYDKNKSFLQQSAPTFDQLFEINDLKALSQEKDTVIMKLKEILKSLNGVNLLSSASGSQPQGNTKKDKIRQTQSKAKKNKLEDHPRTVRPSLNNKKSVVTTKAISSVPNSKLNVNSDLKCATCNGCLFSDNRDLCVLEFINSVNARVKSKSARKLKFLGTVKFENDHVAKIMGYDDYKIGNVTISRVYFVEGLGHNLFSVGQFYDSYLEIAFRQHTCFIRNLDGVDLLTGSRGNSLYTLSLQDMMASSPICLLSKASKTKSWLWHRRLSHLNFGAINHLARQGLVQGLPKLKFKKDHLCLACAMGKSKKKSHKPKSKDTNQEKLYLLHMDLCGPMRVESITGKKYILVIVNDYS
nr:reverse transcriptase domain-containing protein [Tanacetum cinerariifolium]